MAGERLVAEGVALIGRPARSAPIDPSRSAPQPVILEVGAPAVGVPINWGTRKWAMSKVDAEAVVPTSAERDAMHALYRQGGRERQMPPHLVDAGASCPHEDCDQSMQAIDFRLEDHGRAVHDALVRAWWDDTGFAGRWPRCGGWIHFTIRGTRAISPDEAAGFPQLPADWFDRATIL